MGQGGTRVVRETRAPTPPLPSAELSSVDASTFSPSETSRTWRPTWSGTLAEASLPVDDRELDELVRCGIDSVYRVERALPPERPLAPVLDTALQEHLVDRWHSLHAERGDVAAAAVA